MGEVVKKCGEIWSTMTEAQKKPFEDKNAKAKEQYEKEMASYEPDESQFITKKGEEGRRDLEDDDRRAEGSVHRQGGQGQGPLRAGDGRARGVGLLHSICQTIEK